MNTHLFKMLEALIVDDEKTASTELHNYVSENFGNVITRPMDSIVVGLPKIPNVYITKNIPKSKKVLPRLKKNKYGTGIAPAGWQAVDGNGDVSSSSVDGSAGDGGSSGD